MKRQFQPPLTKVHLLSATVALLLVSSLPGLAQDDRPARAETNQPGKTFEVPLDERPVARPNGEISSFAPIVKKVAPAVVKVVTAIKPGSDSANNSDQQEPGGLEDPFWRHFFGPSPRGRSPRGNGLEHGLASGVIVTKDGYILTNSHVVDDAQTVKVTLQGGREFSAKVVGRDTKSDIAVIKIDANNLPTVPFADSQKVEVGDVVLAVGNPFGVGQTVTEGIVSATDRGGMGIEDYENFIQTDAAINPGNSGGALVDAEGRLIGINTAILSGSGGNQGIGFAIPSDLARTIMLSLIQYGQVTRGYLGIQIQDVTPELAKEFHLENATGALVADLVPNGPAAKAGFQEGDVVIQYNGKEVKDGRQLKLSVAETKPGSTVPVEVVRNGKTETVEAKVGRLPGNEQLAQTGRPSQNQQSTVLEGVGVSDLDQQTRQELKVPDTVHGAVVTKIDPGSPAAAAGLRPGDVIESINRQPVQNADEAVRMTENAKSKRTLLRVWSNGGSRFVVVDEGQPG